MATAAAAARWVHPFVLLSLLQPLCVLADAGGGDAAFQVDNLREAHIVLGHLDPSWLDTSGLPDLHALGIRGEGQIIGLGDTGVDTDSCAFADPAHEVPYDKTSSVHRKIAAYFTLNGDRKDLPMGSMQDNNEAGGGQQEGPDGHGTHIAGSIAAPETTALGSRGAGVAPAARLAVVDLEDASRPRVYNVPQYNIGNAYFDLFSSAGAHTACSPWSYEEHASLEHDIDDWVWRQQDFLPVFPSGNRAIQTVMRPQAPCGAKNVLCVGASYNAREAYLSNPGFMHTALRIDSGACTYGADSSGCAEIDALPAFFGATKPAALPACQAVARMCLDTGAACPECAYDPAALERVSNAPLQQASPREACTNMAPLLPGSVCLIDRGKCDFAVKAKECQKAGGIGAVIVNYAATPPPLMVTTNGTDDPSISIPVVLVSKADALVWLTPGQTVTFPLVSKSISASVRAPYSSFNADGRIKPEILLPGDNVESIASGAACGFRTMSGTSQSCGYGAGIVALTRQYLTSEVAEAKMARLINPWASTFRAAVVAAAQTSSGAIVVPEEGFGLAELARVLIPRQAPAAPASALMVMQSEVSASRPQRFCFNVHKTLPLSTKAGDVGLPPRLTLAWTDPAHAAGALVSNLDLSVECDLNGWKRRFPNGLSRPDSVNTVEKVVLPDIQTASSLSSACLVYVTMSSSSAVTQQFSLVAAGRFTLQPGCEMMADRGSCTARSLEREPLSGFGPFCDQIPTEVAVVSSAASSLAVSPLQWSFAHMKLCGSGLYTFELSGATLEQIDVFASRMAGPDLWATWAVRPADWQADGVLFAIRDEGGEFKLTAQVQPAASPASGGDRLFIAVFFRGREGPAALKLRWAAGPAGCPVAAGPASPSTGAGADGSSLVPSMLAVFLGIGLGALAVAIAFGYACWRTAVRRRCQVAPEPADQTFVDSEAPPHPWSRTW